MPHKKPIVIHVNRHFIQANAKDGGFRPVYTIKDGRRTLYAHGVKITGTVEFIDPRQRRQLACGAKAWCEVIDGSVEYTEPCSFVEAKES